MEKLFALIGVLVILVSFALFYLCNILWPRAVKIRKMLRKQGIRGPKPTLLYGNTREMKRIQQELKVSHKQGTNNYISTLFPHLFLWRETYGPVFLYSTGAMEILQVSHPDMVKDLGRWTPSELGKPTYLKKSRKALFGGGLFTVNGDEWAYQRKIIAPEFFVEKIKGMIQLIEDATGPVLEAWECMIDDSGGCREIVVDDYLRNLSADVIARACFGSSFTKGEEIFCKLRQLQKAIAQQDAFVGLSALWKYLPTKSNQEIRTLDEQVRLLILEVAKEHRHHQDPHNGLLSAIIDGAQDGRSAAEAEDFIVGNCKTIYFGGHESTAVTAIWCLMLLATHPEWQERARAEAMEVCRGRTPLDGDALRRLKIVTMVIQETLQLYPPASMMMREALTDDVRLGDVDVPRGTIVQVPRLMLHLDKDAWGADADEFRPERFANGVAAAACRAAHMYVPFGHGPRTCIGQNLAMVELKVVLARLLSKFAFSPSPTYRHLFIQLGLDGRFISALSTQTARLDFSTYKCVDSNQRKCTTPLFI
ncbi:cytochrome P450 714C3-like [Oryza brachyantha]|nr:cytochrome P450 714C3-like [Oryza brachyantha]